MIWSVVLLTATLGTPTVPTGDGQSPVTIIEIPEATTTTTPALVPTGPLVPPESAVLTTRPTPTTASLRQFEEQVPPPAQWPWEWIALALWLWFVLGFVRPRTRRTGVRSALRMSGPGTGGLVLALRHYEPGNNRSEGEGHPAPLPEQPAAISPSTLVRYEAVEYRSDCGSPEVYPRTLGEFGTLEAAIETAALACSSSVRDSQTDAFWVVWNHQLKRAAWVSPRRAHRETVIDLRTGSHDRSGAESTKVSEVET